MRELQALIEIIDALGTPALVVVAYLVYRIRENELPHINSHLDDISTRLARLEGVKEGVELSKVLR